MNFDWLFSRLAVLIPLFESKSGTP